MRLTKKKSLEICVELWAWLAEDRGRLKHNWPGWERNGGIYPVMEHNCPCCDYANQRLYINKERVNQMNRCNRCPISTELKNCNAGSAFQLWRDTKNIKYAKQILKIAKEALAKCS